MDLDKTQIIGYLAILVIVVSLASIGMKFTGFATTTDTAIINITITSSATINFTTDRINFGVGAPDLGKTATVDTEGTLTLGSGWDPQNNLTLENIGNVNVSLGLMSDKLVADFIGGTNSSFKYRVINSSSNAGACIVNNATSYKEFNTVNTGVCGTFPFADDKDEITILIRLVIPSDSKSGNLNATITATGTYT